MNFHLKAHDQAHNLDGKALRLEDSSYMRNKHAFEKINKAN